MRMAEDAIGDDEQLEELAALLRGGAVGEEMISPGRSSEMSIDQLFLRYLNGRVIEDGLDGVEKCMREEDVAIVHNDKQHKQQEQEEKQRVTLISRTARVSPPSQTRHKTVTCH